VVANSSAVIHAPCPISPPVEQPTPYQDASILERDPAPLRQGGRGPETLAGDQELLDVVWQLRRAHPSMISTL
jgi:hypothetical protein